MDTEERLSNRLAGGCNAEDAETGERSRSGPQGPGRTPIEKSPPRQHRGRWEAPVLGYATIPRDEHHANGDLRQQSEEIVAECDRQGLSLLEIVHEREPRGGHVAQRPGLGYALSRISSGEARGLVVAELPRLTHSVPQLGLVLQWFLDCDARLIAAAPGLDTESEAGRIAARTIIDVSRWEREWLIERTRRGMRAARRKGPPGVADFPELRSRIAGMRAEGMTLQAIADQLNYEGVPTVRGGAKWRPSSVQAAAGYQRPRAQATPGFASGSLGARRRARAGAWGEPVLAPDPVGAPEVRRFRAMQDPAAPARRTGSYT